MELYICSVITILVYAIRDNDPKELSIILRMKSVFFEYLKEFNIIIVIYQNVH